MTGSKRVEFDLKLHELESLTRLSPLFAMVRSTKREREKNCTTILKCNCVHVSYPAKNYILKLKKEPLGKV